MIHSLRTYFQSLSGFRSLAAIFLLPLLLLACDEKGPSSPDEFSNSLAFGSALASDGSDLVGVTRTLRLDSSGSVTVFFRVESQQDLVAKGLEMEFQKVETNGSRSIYRTVPFTASQATPHVVVSSFILTDAAVYTISARTVSDPSVTIASDDLTLLPQ